jgi:hypothetical protein
VVAFAEFNTLYSEAVVVPDQLALCLGSVHAARGDEQIVYRSLRQAGITYVLFEFKQKRRLEEEALAITGAAFERRYLEVVYEDSRAVLYRLVEPPQV